MYNFGVVMTEEAKKVLSFQYPVEIPGVSMTNFMRAAINAKREYQGLEPLNTSEFMKLMREKTAVEVSWTVQKRLHF